MQYREELSSKKIKEFLDLVENHKVDIRHYRTPVLVWGVNDGTVYYSFWEQETLQRYGLDNVDGYDYEEDLLFCPDWMADADEPQDDDIDLDDDDLGLICDLKLHPRNKS
ncbi:MAG: hypothetical protein KBB33_07870 [Candidatus Cloacimonetes bacterium]|nr:hypothetical protein [Candidatus Cloacimonadota bacterium]